MDEFVSKKLLVAKFNKLASKYIDGDKRQRGLAYTTAADMIALADVADVQPLSVVAEHIKKRLYETAFDTNELIAREAITDIAERIDFWIDELKEGELMIDAEKDMKLMTDVMSQICNYAIENGMKPTETLKTVANNILMITEISNFDGWGSKDGGTND